MIPMHLISLITVILGIKTIAVLNMTHEKFRCVLSVIGIYQCD